MIISRIYISNFSNLRVEASSTLLSKYFTVNVCMLSDLYISRRVLINSNSLRLSSHTAFHGGFISVDVYINLINDN